MKQFRILSILSASAFYPFCPHRILSFLSVRPSVRRLSVRESVRPYPRFIQTLSVPFTVNVDDICISTGIKVPMQRNFHLIFYCFSKKYCWSDEE
jgi:hypothetical protein